MAGREHGVVAVGDSLLNGYGPAFAGVTCLSWAAWIAWSLNDCLTQHAVNGATVEQVARDQLPLIRGGFRVGAAWMGANDLGRSAPRELSGHVQAVCRRLRDCCDLAAVATLPAALRIPTLHWRIADQHRVALNDVIRTAAADSGCVLVELDQLLAGPWSMAPNRQHPSALGNLEAARAAAVALDAAGARFMRHLPDPGRLVLSKDERRQYAVGPGDRIRGAWSSLRARIDAVPASS